MAEATSSVALPLLWPSRCCWVSNIGQFNLVKQSNRASKTDRQWCFYLHCLSLTAMRKPNMHYHLRRSLIKLLLLEPTVWSRLNSDLRFWVVEFSHNLFLSSTLNRGLGHSHVTVCCAKWFDLFILIAQVFQNACYQCALTKCCTLI